MLIKPLKVIYKHDLKIFPLSNNHYNINTNNNYSITQRSNISICKPEKRKFSRETRRARTQPAHVDARGQLNE